LTRGIAIPYDPQATCPQWEAFLWRIMGGTVAPDAPDISTAEMEARAVADARARALVAFLQRMVGYTLTGSTREQCLFLLYGRTKTGKSTFLGTIGELMGPYGKQAETSTFLYKERDEVRNDLADLAGSRYVSAVEMQQGRRLAEALVKRVTGGTDKLKARFLFHEYFEFRPQFKLFFGTNHRPVIKENDDAIWERLRLVPFAVHIPKEERDLNLDARLRAELTGILTWAVQGCLAWQAQGLAEPAEVMQATKEYQAEHDVIQRFLDECCTTTVADAKVKSGVLYDAFKKWCERTREDAGSAVTFSRTLEEKGFTKHKAHGTMIWDKLGLNAM
jgi:putative DNA primase/helicase